MRRTWSVTALLLVSSTVGVISLSDAAVAAPVAGYEALTPSRVLDTRSGLGATGKVGPNAAISIDVTGVGGVPAAGVGAVVVNVTGTEATEPTFVTVWPSDQARPTASNLNVVPGEDTPNLVIATVAADGTISLYNFAGSIHLVADVTGWFPLGSSYSALTPSRVLDTRTNLGAQGPVGSGGVITLDVTGAGGVPSAGVGAVVVNVTATNVTAPTYVTVWPGDQPQPNASNLNARGGQSTPNLVVAAVGGDGTIKLYNYAGTLDLVADVTGWFPIGADYSGVNPYRVLDTRTDSGAQGPVGPGGVITLDVTGVGGVPASGVAAVVLNVTSTEATERTFVTVWPGDEPQPLASNLNARSGEDIPNLVIATVAANGTVNLFNFAGNIHLVADILGWIPVSAGGGVDAARSFTCGVRGDGTVWCWGSNEFGQLGNGTMTNSPTPVQVSGLTTAVAVTTGDYHSCATLADATVRCWGYNEGGQLGNGATGPTAHSSTPVTVSGIGSAETIFAGAYHTCAVLEDRTVRCWGFNATGQLGNGTMTDSPLPVPVTGITTATAVAGGGYHSCALLVGGGVSCWGSNDFGELGVGNTADSATPVAVTGVTTAAAVAGGIDHTCAVLANKTTACWGNNASGQLGNGTTTDSAVAVPVSGLAGVSAITAGQNHSCAVLQDQTARCWGEGSFGQLGDGTSSNASTPVQVVGIADAVDVTAGWNHSCARLDDRSLRCWGDNSLGQLGDGTTTNRPTPVPVVSFP